MKKIILTLLITIFTLTLSFSQDIILKKSGDEIKAKVIEVNIDNIKYKVFENIDGPIYTISKTEVFMIKYQNGSKDVFKEIEQIKETEQTESEQISHTKTEPFRKGIYLGLHITPGAVAIFRKMDENFGINSGADVCIYFNDYVGIKTGFSFLSIPIIYEYFNPYYSNNGY
ncbi:MAG: hypothetical protein COX70_08010 [Flavobacteriales bacterium CG_4_10_14_0_2_um_filter_32_8]|nr:MAG: hypothetical protein COX70_08010 [Flavobacteriales bacterium CG_4_10_14_0_2_um_filter_32_8]